MDDLSGFEGVVLNCNRLAMDYLKNGNHRLSLQYLQKAEQMLQQEEESKTKLKLSAITLNNFGWFYKKRSNFTLALEYLQTALDVEQQSSGDPTNMAATHLNICAIYSQLDNHNQAHQHCVQAVNLLEFDWDESENTATTIIIAYHNLGVESEHLGRSVEASQAYRTGFTIATQKLGPTHSLTCNLKASYNAVKHQEKIPEAQKDLYEGGPPSFLPKLINNKSRSLSKINRKNAPVSQSFEAPSLPKNNRKKTAPKESIYDKRFLTGNRKQPMHAMVPVRYVFRKKQKRPKLQLQSVSPRKVKYDTVKRDLAKRDFPSPKQQTSMTQRRVGGGYDYTSTKNRPDFSAHPTRKQNRPRPPDHKRTPSLPTPALQDHSYEVNIQNQGYNDRYGGRTYKNPNISDEVEVQYAPTPERHTPSPDLDESVASISIATPYDSFEVFKTMTPEEESPRVKHARISEDNPQSMSKIKSTPAAAVGKTPVALLTAETPVSELKKNPPKKVTEQPAWQAKKLSSKADSPVSKRKKVDSPVSKAKKSTKKSIKSSVRSSINSENQKTVKEVDFEPTREEIQPSVMEDKWIETQLLSPEEDQFQVPEAAMKNLDFTMSAIDDRLNMLTEKISDFTDKNLAAQEVYQNRSSPDLTANRISQIDDKIFGMGANLEKLQRRLNDFAEESARAVDHIMRQPSEISFAESVKSVQYSSDQLAAEQIENALARKLYARGFDRIRIASTAPIWIKGTQYSNPYRDSLLIMFRLFGKSLKRIVMNNIIERATAKSVGIQYDPISHGSENLDYLYWQLKKALMFRQMAGIGATLDRLAIVFRRSRTRVHLIRWSLQHPWYFKRAYIASKLQPFMDKICLRHNIRRYLKAAKAPTEIASAMRGYISREQSRKASRERDIAIVTIRNYSRMVQERKKFKEIQAATKSIQKSYKAYKLRSPKHFKQLIYNI